MNLPLAASSATGAISSADATVEMMYILQGILILDLDNYILKQLYN